MASKRFGRKNRSTMGFFVAMPKAILESDEYAALTAFEVKLLMDLFAQFNGQNNGDFHCAWSIMHKRGWRSKDTLNRALRGLINKGFVQLTRQGGKHRCSLFAVTWLAIDDCKGKLDISPTRVAPGTWKKNKIVVQLPGHIVTSPVPFTEVRPSN